MFRGRFTIGLLWVLPAGLLAAETTSPVTVPTSPLGSSAMLQTFGGLLLVLLSIFVLGWFFRRFGKLPAAGRGMVSVVGGISLGPRERAVVLEVEGVRLLVGVAPGRVQTLHVLNPAPNTGSEGNDPAFQQRLQAEIGERSK